MVILSVSIVSPIICSIPSMLSNTKSDVESPTKKALMKKVLTWKLIIIIGGFICYCTGTSEEIIICNIKHGAIWYIYTNCPLDSKASEGKV